MPQTNRQNDRTQRSLQNAMLSLLEEKDYAKITVQDIIHKANVGRTTFYAHYRSKQDLLVSCHDDVFRDLSLGVITAAGLLQPAPQPDLISFLATLQQQRALYYLVMLSHDAIEILRGMQAEIAERCASRLHNLYAESESNIPFAVLANHIAGSMMHLIGWWVENQPPYSPEEIAGMLHRLQESAVRSALAL